MTPSKLPKSLIDLLYKYSIKTGQNWDDIWNSLTPEYQNCLIDEHIMEDMVGISDYVDVVFGRAVRFRDGKVPDTGREWGRLWPLGQKNRLHYWKEWLELGRTVNDKAMIKICVQKIKEVSCLR